MICMFGDGAMNIGFFHEAENLVKKFNGWDKRLEKERSVVGMYSPGITSEKKVIPRLVFRYGSSILTTLDTGGSTKPVTN